MHAQVDCFGNMQIIVVPNFGGLLFVSPGATFRTWRDNALFTARAFFITTNAGSTGLNLQAAEKKYEPYLESISSRGELNYLFQEMLGELTIGHLGAGGSSDGRVGEKTRALHAALKRKTI